MASGIMSNMSVTKNVALSNLNDAKQNFVHKTKTLPKTPNLSCFHAQFAQPFFATEFGKTN